jgi:glycerol uptake facilitator-like aquaporin
MVICFVDNEVQVLSMSHNDSPNPSGRATPREGVRPADPLAVEDRTPMEAAMEDVPEHLGAEKEAMRPLPLPRANTPGVRAQSSTSAAADPHHTLTKAGSLSVKSESSLKISAPASVDPEIAARLYAQHELALKSVRGQFNILKIPDFVMLHPLMGAYLAEAIGTFAFVLTISLVQVNNLMYHGSVDTNMTSLPIGFMLMCMVFTFGYISGGHFNPAVTIAVLLSRNIDTKRASGYIVSQCAASLGAGLVAMIIQGNNNIFVPNVDKTSYISSGVFAELIYTFALATVVLHVAYSRQKHNFFYGFAIGMTVSAGQAAVGNISGGAFNPAVATGLQVAVCLTGSCSAISLIWLYWLAPLIGAGLAAFLYAQMKMPDLSEDNS